MLRIRPFLAFYLLAACSKAPPPGNPAFDDAVHETFIEFPGTDADLAFSVRTLDDNIESNLDLTSSNPSDRSITPERLTEADVADLTHPDVDPADCLPVAVAGVSKYPPDDQALIQVLADQTPVEPYSPHHYDRTFLEGGDCWLDRSCLVMKTSNDVIKENLLMTIPYVFLKDFRWVDLNLPDPADVATGDTATDTGTPRWAYVARSWQEQSFQGNGGSNAFLASYTIEAWIPHDNEDGTPGTLHVLSVWADTQLGMSVSDDLVAGTTRSGIDANFHAAEDWLDANVGTN